MAASGHAPYVRSNTRPNSGQCGVVVGRSHLSGKPAIPLRLSAGGFIAPTRCTRGTTAVGANHRAGCSQAALPRLIVMRIWGALNSSTGVGSQSSNDHSLACCKLTRQAWGCLDRRPGAKTDTKVSACGQTDQHLRMHCKLFDAGEGERNPARPCGSSSVTASWP